jgi:predicted anti-sigma-YlaC factor YlaD
MTTDRVCKRRQRELTDVFYNERSMNKELEEHLENCQQCRTHWEMLHDFKKEFAVLDISTETNIKIIRDAFQIVGERERIHRERMDLLVFIIIAMAIMAGVVFAAIIGYSIEMIITLAIFTLLAPFVVPVFFIMKLKKENA